jgi:hypothetical protein
LNFEEEEEEEEYSGENSLKELYKMEYNPFFTQLSEEVKFRYLNDFEDEESSKEEEEKKEKKKK